MNTRASFARAPLPVSSEVVSVSDLTSQIKNVLQSSFFSVSVKGEISNLKEQSSGHTYFTLKDKDAQLSAVLFKNYKPFLSSPLKEGEEVIVKGELSVYAPRGSYQLVVKEVEQSGALGELLKQWHELKLKLQIQGWFDLARKKTLPSFPRVIGVITSPTGAVIQDIIHILERRFPGFHLLLNPVKVQGEGAAKEIKLAIEQCNQYRLADVLIVGRGGGSLEDLAPFNDELVASAIYHSTIPIISAVGHETDFTIADLVADLRAPTPSAAAEVVIGKKEDYLRHLRETKSRFLRLLSQTVLSLKKRIETINKQPLLQTPYLFLNPFQQKLDLLCQDMQNAIKASLLQRKSHLYALTKQKEALRPGRQLSLLKKSFEKIEKEMLGVTKKTLFEKRRAFEELLSRLEMVHPKNVLKKGYSIVFHENSASVILSENEVKEGEMLRICLSEGELRALVKEKQPQGKST